MFHSLFHVLSRQYYDTRGAPDPQFSDPAGSGSKPDLDILVPAGSGQDPTTPNPAGSASIPDPNLGIQASYRVFT